MKNSIYRFFFTSTLILLFLAGCKKSSKALPIPSSKPGPKDSLDATIINPQKINIYPVIVKNGAGAGRIYINTMRVGGVTVNIPLLFDTGSAGVTLNALTVFPNNIVDRDGFKFKPGQDTLRYKDIVITKTNAQKVFGSAGAVETREIGNIGYAKLTVGDASGSLKMLTMPILFFYKKFANGIESTNGLGSVFGVNTFYNGVQSTQDSTSVFKLVSPLKYLLYKNNLVAGYKLNAVTLNGCAINIPGSCQPQPLLTVGLTTDDNNNYRLNQLKVLTPQSNPKPPAGWPAYPSYSLYYPTIANAIIGTAYHNQTVNVLLDSGNPGVILNTTKENLRAGAYPLITLTLPSKSTYDYNCNRANFTTKFNPASKRSVYGIYFFTIFNFMEDYQNGLIGLRVK